MLEADDEIESMDFHKVNKNNFEQIQIKANKIGYADGVNDGRESVFQNGFDQGYKDGLRTSFQLEKFRYFFKNLNNEKISNLDFLKEKQIYEDLNILEAKSQQHFKYLQYTDKNLEIVSQKQHEYVDETMETFANRLPITSDLLKDPSIKDFI